MEQETGTTKDVILKPNGHSAHPEDLALDCKLRGGEWKDVELDHYLLRQDVQFWWKEARRPLTEWYFCYRSAYSKRKLRRQENQLKAEIEKSDDPRAVMELIGRCRQQGFETQAKCLFAMGKTIGKPCPDFNLSIRNKGNGRSSLDKEGQQQ